MNITQFLDRWKIVENPFRAEEARHDPVFSRLGVGPTTHPDFDKILGDLSRPSTAVVFGEKGTGKTAIRLQIGERAAEHNLRSPEARVALVAYDELNPVLDRVAHHRGVDLSSSPEEIDKALGSLRLVDHIDAILQRGATALVSHTLGDRDGESIAMFGEQSAQRLRRGGQSVQADLLLLAALYDTSDQVRARLRGLRKTLRRGLGAGHFLRRSMAYAGWALPAGLLVAGLFAEEGRLEGVARTVWLGSAIALTAVWIGVFLYEMVLKPFALRRTGRALTKQVRVSGRSVVDYAAALGELRSEDRPKRVLPTTESDDVRYELLAKLRKVYAALGITGLVVVLDRVDEPTLVSGYTNRMRAVVWPLLNNKFLQQQAFGLKMLLPVELRHELFRETSNFFQEARLDKQNLIERLAWTGSTLYDLCNARLAACRAGDAEPVSLVDLFDEDVTRQDLIDALDQMHQPRDAFKMLYGCMQEHCANTSEEEPRWRIPKLTLDAVRRQQAERVQMLYRGIAPG